MTGEECIDAVTVHELAHIRYKNHNKDFYALVRSYIPDYDEREKKLKEYGRMISAQGFM
jgi:predicted metal-dependent hydrolase